MLSVINFKGKIMKKLLVSLMSLVIAHSALATTTDAAATPTYTYISPSTSMSDKRSEVKSVLENAPKTGTNVMYIYYHDDKSQQMATNLQSKIADKVSSNTTISLVNQKSGTPAYTGKTTDGIAITIKNSQ